jgi:hypothetical protein
VNCRVISVRFIKDRGLRSDTVRQITIHFIKEKEREPKVRYAHVNKNEKTDVRGWARSVVFVFGDFVGHHYRENQKKWSKMERMLETKTTQYAR